MELNGTGFGINPFSTYAQFSEKLTFLPPDTHTYLCVSGSRKVNFSENMRSFLNGWSLKALNIIF